MFETVDHDKVDDWVEVIIFSSLIDWLVDVCISMFMVVSEDEMVFDIDICVIAVEVNSLLVLTEVCVDKAVSDMMVEDIDGYIELLIVAIGWIDDVSKIDVIMFELWCEIDDGVAVWVVVICVDDNDELSVELETPLIVVVTNSVSGEDVVVSIEVAYECAIVDNDIYSPALDVYSKVRNVVSLLVLEILFVFVEINWVVDSSDSIDEVWLLSELNGAVNTDVSDEIDSLLEEVPVAMDKSSISVVDNCG